MSGLKRTIAIAALAVLAMMPGPGRSAHARELIRERFESISAGIPADDTATGRDGGRGFSLNTTRPFTDAAMGYLDLPVAFGGSGTRGAISFDLQRKAGNGIKGRRTLFELLDAEGRQILSFQVQWTSPFDPRLPAIFIRGEEYWIHGRGLWSQQTLLDREVSPGQWIHVDIAWDDAAGKYLLYVDGRPQDVAPKYWSPRDRGRLPDPRLDVNASAKWGRTPPSSVPKPFSHFLSRVAAFRIGVDSHPRGSHVAASFLSNSVLDDFVVLADEWPRGLSGASQILSVSDDTFRAAGTSGTLVAGDTVHVELVAAPGGRATFDLGKVNAIPMEEIPPTEGGPGIPPVAPGTYRGSHAVRPGDDYVDGRVLGRFVSADNVAADPVLSASRWTIDTRPVVTFAIDKNDLPADSSSRARIKLKVVDANGNPVVGRHLKLTLSTTDEYTGLVGGGDFGEEVGATAEPRWKGETDAWGEVEFDYRAGFAAKTVILSAKDLDSGNVSVDYVTAYKEASIDIALTPPINRAAARRGIQYILKVEATRTELTADGRSRSVIRATLLDPAGTPVPGDPIEFFLSSSNGSLRVIRGTTDSTGTAVAEYTAGKKIGIVVVTATAAMRNAQGNVSILLLSDAPAKIHLAARPSSLPADGLSRADIDVKVTDVNDNPNADTKVEFRVAKGGGQVEYPDRVTDRFGDAANRYTAGTVPGVATILATVRSRVPTDAELTRARNVLFVPYSELGEEIRVERWLKKKGDTALKDEPVVEYTIGRDAEVRQIRAPYDCRIDFQHVESWDDAQTGDTLAQIAPVAIPGSAGGQAPVPMSPRRR